MDDASTMHAGGALGQTGLERSGFPVDPYRLRRAVLHGKRLLIGSALFGLLAGFAWVKLMMHSRYETTAVLKYEGDLQVAGLPPTHDALVPAADAFVHQSVLRKIAEEIGYEESLDSLERQILYNVLPQEGTVEVTVEGDTGEEAAEFAQVVVDVFMNYHKERQSRRFDAEMVRMQKRLKDSEHQVNVARSRYNDFRKQHGIADLSTEQQSMVQSAASLRADGELRDIGDAGARGPDSKSGEVSREHSKDELSVGRRIARARRI